MTDSPTPSQRQRYLRGGLTHDQYYGLIVEHLGEDALRRMLPRDWTPAQWRDALAEDQHLNNVPLRLWDAADYGVRSLAARSDRDGLTRITGNGGAWSLSDTVCTLKQTAKRLAR